jgi:hypothetical protein
MNPAEKSRLSPEEAFLKEMTRKRLVEWCHRNLVESLPPASSTEDRIYLEYAQAKGWVSKDGQKILAAGWKTAAAFLKR